MKRLNREGGGVGEKGQGIEVAREKERQAI